MKRIILLIISVFYYLLSNAQMPVQVITLPGSKYVYVGSLIMENSSGGNSQKIIVKIFGGSFFSDSNGETSYYISNRGGLSVKQTSLGSYSKGRISLKAYQNGDNIDFYIVPNPNDYASFAVTSFTFGNGIAEHYINIITQRTVPDGTDMGNSLQIIPLMMTDEAGNIGLGTSTPRETLSVNGKIRAHEIKVDAQNWPDYIFEEGYKVENLEELERYIKTNKHLPEIPTAKEVNEHGVALGEMNKLLLKKIEELTLHLIEQQGQLNEQGKLIKVLQEITKIR
ncbi:hypothetical protein [Pedobacter miscanthi]|uniref:hypothetical protein n=1 Tax=Pedobacter miscanthi TaxID=2259170 RepID=UPI00292F138F|nr:hypothetical protein [Pedobacter miscanthi]